MSQSQAVIDPVGVSHVVSNALLRFETPQFQTMIPRTTHEVFLVHNLDTRNHVRVSREDSKTGLAVTRPVLNRLYRAD